MARLFADQTVVITGGSSGLGLSLARTFLERGAFVYLLARNRERLDAAAALLIRDFSNVGTVAADVTCQAQVDAAFERVRSERPGINVLVNAAGMSHRAAILETTPEQFQRLWDLNFQGTVRCTRAAAGELLRSRGHLINIGSLASKIAAAYLGAYPASKFAVAAYTQQLRLELGPQGLHVLLVCPGPLRRDDAGTRYDDQASGLPDVARRPGGGVAVGAIDPAVLGRRIIRACERRQAELVVPGKVRWLAALSDCAPALGDWIVRRKTGQRERQ
jgi:NAD(P)-dependent dehydrogenase (short-subunit alcohol dehydrogenase family)